NTRYSAIGANAVIRRFCQVSCVSSNVTSSCPNGRSSVPPLTTTCPSLPPPPPALPVLAPLERRREAAVVEVCREPEARVERARRLARIFGKQIGPGEQRRRPARPPLSRRRA